VGLLTSVRLRIDRIRRRMLCRDAVELMTEYLEGTLPPAERRRFEAHLVHCDACTAYLDQMRVTIEVLGRLDAGGLPVAVREELVELYRRLQRS
jgi:anti-sigma factor RsiW